MQVEELEWLPGTGSNRRPGDYESPFLPLVRVDCSGLINPCLRISDKIHPGYEKYRDGKIGLSMEEIARQAAKQGKASKII